MFTELSIISIILFAAGIFLIGIEIFEFGFSGFFGILGAIVLIVNIFITASTVREGIIFTAILFVVIVVIFVVFLVLTSKGRMPSKMILRESEEGFSGVEDMRYLLGKTGVVSTICRPVGSVDFDGVKLDVVSRGEFIEKGTAVEVVEVNGNRLVVRAK